MKLGAEAKSFCTRSLASSAKLEAVTEAKLVNSYVRRANTKPMPDSSRKDQQPDDYATQAEQLHQAFFAATVSKCVEPERELHSQF